MNQARRKSHVTALEFAEAIGVGFSMDWDEEVIIEYPDEVNLDALQEYLEEIKQCLAKEFQLRSRRLKERLIGGPFNGRPNCCYFKCCKDYYSGLKVARAKWAVYRQHGDGRAFFVGFAKSELKARRCELYEAVRKEKE